MRGRFCRAGWGEGGRSKPGSVAVWTCARFCFCVHGRTSCRRSQRPPPAWPFLQPLPASSTWLMMEVHMPWTFSDCTGTWLSAMTTNQSATRNWRSPPPPSCRRQGRLARASFSGPAKLSTLFPVRPLTRVVEGHNLRGRGRPRKLRRGPAGRGRAGAPERGERPAGGGFVSAGSAGGKRFSGSGGAMAVGCPAGDLVAGDGGAVGLSAGRPCGAGRGAGRPRRPA